MDGTTVLVACHHSHFVVVVVGVESLDERLDSNPWWMAIIAAPQG